MVNHGGKYNSLSSDTDFNNFIIKTFIYNVFTNTETEDKIYPVTVSGIAANQHLDKTLKTFFKKKTQRVE